MPVEWSSWGEKDLRDTDEGKEIIVVGLVLEH